MIIQDRPHPGRPGAATPLLHDTIARRRLQQGAYASRSPVGALILIAMLSISAGPALTTLELVRAGNAAFAAEDYAAAVQFYTRAENVITDPGLVAFNKAAALYHLGRYREAELHYLRCQEDADGVRRARVLFDLGNSVVQQSQGTDARLLDRAIRFYEQCLRLEDLSADLKENATSNLRLTRELRQRAKPGVADTKPANQKTGDPDDKSKPPRSNGSASESADPGQPGSDKGTGQREAGKEGKAQLSRRTQAGTGNLPPVPDDEKLVPMPPADALAHLQRVAERIEAERRKQQQRTIPAARNTLDW